MSIDMIVKAAESAHHQVELSYELPVGVQGLRTITLSLLSSSIAELSKAILLEEGDLPFEQKAHKILDAIKSHFMYHFKMDLTSSTLARVTCWVGMLAADGKIKVSSRAHLSVMLRTVATIVADPRMTI